MTLVTKEMTMGEIIQKWPAAADIMQSYGLHCFGCHINLFESLEQGIVAHGMPEEQMNSLLDDLNRVAESVEEPSGENTEKTEDVSLTEKAVEKMRGLLKEKDGYGIRLKVVEGGCAGYRYDMDFENTRKENDTVMEKDGIKIFIDSDSFRFLKGVTIDYEEGLQGAGFKFSNPNAKAACGCGKSFH